MASETWLDVQLSEIIDVKHGFAFPGANIRDQPPGDILLTPGNFTVGGGFKGDRYKYFDGSVPEEYVLHENDLIVTMTDLSKQADTLGYPALVPKPQHFRFLHNQRLGKVQIRDGAKVDKRFLSYLLRTPEYRHEVLASATGTTVKHTSPGRILAFKTSIPPLSEQRDIAHILGTLDDKIVLNRQMNETLEAMARALFKSWFVDFNPVRAKAEGRDPGLPKHIADLFPDSLEDSELGEIPKGWVACPLYETARFINGAAFKTEDFCAPREGLPVVKIAELKDGLSAQTKYSQRAVDVGQLIDTSDLLYSWSGSPDTSLDAFVWTKGPGLLNQHIFKVVARTAAQKRFVYYLLKFLRPKLVEIARNKQTTGLGHVTVADMKRLQVCWPSETILAVFDRQVIPIFDRAFNNTLETQNLGALRDVLLPKLISGELRVKDAEQMAEIA